jgi:hypothetical protein
VSEDITLPIKVLRNDIELPSYAYAGDAGLDLRSAECYTIEPSQRVLISTGFAIALPSGYAGLVVPRSGLAVKHGITVTNAPGLIDSGYRGEIKVSLLNTSTDSTFVIEKGDRIAQLVVVAVPQVNLVVCNELTETQRGEGGFGSSGVRA